MGHPKPLGGKDAHGVRAPLGALNLVVPGGQLFHLHGTGLPAEGHRGPVAVVPVLVAAIDGVSLQMEGGQTGDGAVLIGVDDKGARLSGQGEAGVAVPDQFHFKIPPDMGLDGQNMERNNKIIARFSPFEKQKIQRPFFEGGKRREGSC